MLVYKPDKPVYLIFGFAFLMGDVGGHSWVCPSMPALHNHHSFISVSLGRLNDPLSQSQCVISNNLQFLSLPSFALNFFISLSVPCLLPCAIFLLTPSPHSSIQIHPMTHILVSGPWKNCGMNQLLDICHFFNLALRSVLLLC